MLVVVLNDGETYTNLEGCKILWIRDDAAEREQEETGDLDSLVKEMIGQGQGVSLYPPSKIREILPEHIRKAEHI